MPPLLLFEKLSQTRLEFRKRHLPGAALLDQDLCNPMEILHGRSEYDRNAQRRRFDRVLPALRNEAAADHGNVGLLVSL